MYLCYVIFDNKKKTKIMKNPQTVIVLCFFQGLNMEMKYIAFSTGNFVH